MNFGDDDKAALGVLGADGMNRNMKSSLKRK